MRHQLIAAACLAVLASSTASQAHHSFAMFDRTTEKTFTGSVRQFDWTNPHTYLDVISDTDHHDWTLEAGGVNGLLHAGLHKSVLSVGDHVTVHFHPLRNGATGGQLLYVVKDGKTIDFGGAAQPPATDN